MESLFPQLFFLSFVAQIILRIAIGGVMLYDGWKLWRSGGNARFFASAIALLGILIAVGLFTQVAVIGAGIMTILAAIRFKSASVFGNMPTTVLTLATLLYLLVAGPGGFAFDLPY